MILYKKTFPDWEGFFIYTKFYIDSVVIKN